MLKPLSIAFIFCFVQNVSASEIIFNRLNNLYKQDAKKCLVVAKRYIKYLPNNGTSFFFASKIHEDKAVSSKTSRGKYLHIKRAINFASDFECKSNDALKVLAEWSNFKSELIQTAATIITLLSENNQFDLRERLSSSVASLNNEYFDIEFETEEVEKNEINELHKSLNSTLTFSGMPDGTELVKSASLSGEKALLKCINTERIKQGLVPLEWQEDLAKASRYHAYDLGSQNYFNHSTYDRKDGKLVKIGGTFERIKKFYSASYVNSENIAAGNSTAYATYLQWYNSPGHYANMFNPESTKIGIGVSYLEDSPFGYYWSMCTAH